MQGSRKQFNIAIVGHPESGKTSLHRALTAGSKSNDLFAFQDLAGSHMLAPNTVGEREVYDILLGRRPDPEGHPDGIVVVVDAQRLETQLYFVSQVIDLRLPVVVALNWIERAAGLGLSVNKTRLEQLLDVPVVQVNPALSERGDAIRTALEDVMSRAEDKKYIHWRPSVSLAEAYNHLDSNWSYKHLPLHPGARLIEGLRLLSNPKAVEEYADHPAHRALHRTLQEARNKISGGEEAWIMTEMLQRHQWADMIAKSVVTKGQPTSWLERGRITLAQTPFWVGWAFLAVAGLLLIPVLWYFFG